VLDLRISFGRGRWFRAVLTPTHLHDAQRLSLNGDLRVTGQGRNVLRAETPIAVTATLASRRFAMGRDRNRRTLKCRIETIRLRLMTL